MCYFRCAPQGVDGPPAIPQGVDDPPAVPQGVDGPPAIPQGGYSSPWSYSHRGLFPDGSSAEQAGNPAQRAVMHKEEKN